MRFARLLESMQKIGALLTGNSSAYALLLWVTDFSSPAFKTLEKQDMFSLKPGKIRLKIWRMASGIEAVPLA